MQWSRSLRKFQKRGNRAGQWNTLKYIFVFIYFVRCSYSFFLFISQYLGNKNRDFYYRPFIKQTYAKRLFRSNFLDCSFLNADNLGIVFGHTQKFLKGLQAYAILLFQNTLYLYFAIGSASWNDFLQDPITAFFLNSVNVVTKDLFFSGHISAMCLFLYFTDNKVWKTYLMIATPMLALLILWQHVHYTIDVVAAPFFAFICCKFIDVVNERWEFGLDNIQSEQLELSRNEL